MNDVHLISRLMQIIEIMQEILFRKRTAPGVRKFLNAICVYVYLNICIFIRIYMYVYLCTNTYTCTCLYMYMHRCPRITPLRMKLTASPSNDNSMLQCVAVCCRVLQCVAVCCSVLQCVAV